MITILASLLYIYIQISKATLELVNHQKWFVKLPVSIYLGWISVATIANVSQVLFLFDWGGWEYRRRLGGDYVSDRYSSWVVDAMARKQYIIRTGTRLGFCWNQL